MKRLINRQQASNAIDALNQITHIKQNLESIKKKFKFYLHYTF